MKSAAVNPASVSQHPCRGMGCVRGGEGTGEKGGVWQCVLSKVRPFTLGGGSFINLYLNIWALNMFHIVGLTNGCECPKGMCLEV